jgi:hypothetical protein
MIAAWARVGANAPKGGDTGSLAGAKPGGRADEVTDVLAEECRVYLADFCRRLQRHPR